MGRRLVVIFSLLLIASCQHPKSDHRTGYVAPSQIPTPSVANTVLEYDGGAVGWTSIATIPNLVPTGGTEGQALFEVASGSQWTTFTGDVTCSTSVPGYCTVGGLGGASIPAGSGCLSRSGGSWSFVSCGGGGGSISGSGTQYGTAVWSSSNGLTSLGPCALGQLQIGQGAGAYPTCNTIGADVAIQSSGAALVQGILSEPLPSNLSPGMLGWSGYSWGFQLGAPSTIPVWSASGLSSIPASSTAGYALTANSSGPPSWQPVSGSGISGGTQYYLADWTGSTTLGTIATGTAGRLLIDQGPSSYSAFETISQDLAFTNAGVASVLGATAATGNFNWAASPSTARYLRATGPISDVSPGPGIALQGAPAWSSASMNTTGELAQIQGGAASNGNSGATFLVSGGFNAAASTYSKLFSDALTFNTSAAAQVAQLTISASPSFFPTTTNTGTIGASGNVWNNVYSTNHVLSGPAAHSVLIGEGASNIVGVGPSSASGTPLVANGSSADPLFQSLNLASSNAVGASVLPPANGGTGVASPTQYGIMVAEGASAVHAVTLPSTELLVGTGGDPTNTTSIKWNDSTGVMQLTTATPPTSVPSTGAYLYSPSGVLETYASSGPIVGLGAATQGTPASGSYGQRQIERKAFALVSTATTSPVNFWSFNISPVLDGAGQAVLAMDMTVMNRESAYAPFVQKYLCVISYQGGTWYPGTSYCSAGIASGTGLVGVSNIQENATGTTVTLNISPSNAAAADWQILIDYLVE